MSNYVPVVFILFGSIPDYLYINIEIALRNNPVVIITNQQDLHEYGAQSVKNKLTFAKLSDYESAAKAFSPLYKHMSRDNSMGRFSHELHCLQRWFILRDYMTSTNTSWVFFGDGDSSVFVSIDKIIRSRKACHSVINIDRQKSQTYWVGAGEASIWSIAAIDEFCRFITDMYRYYHKTLLVKAKTRTSVVDMSILWLWWVAHHDAPGWGAGRPWRHNNRSASPVDVDFIRNISDNAFRFTKSLSLPRVNSSLSVCNGLDVVDRTVFDHKAAWEVGDGFSLNLNESGVPYVIGACLRSGGRPESVEPKQAEALSTQRLYLNNVHYQGDSKQYIAYDVCRVLLHTGSRRILSPQVRLLCDQELRARAGLPCVRRVSSLDRSILCI